MRPLFEHAQKAAWVKSVIAAGFWIALQTLAHAQSYAPAVNYAVQPQPSTIAVADFNNDHNLDLVVANSTSNSIGILFGRGDGTFNSPLNVAVGDVTFQPSAVAAADFNGDGNMDIAVTLNSQSLVFGTPAFGEFQILLGNGNGTFQPPITISVPVVNHTISTLAALLDQVVAADFNRDGRPDLAILSSGNGILVYINNGAGSFSLNPSLIGSTSNPINPIALAIADFNGDGIPDIAELEFTPAFDLAHCASSTPRVLFGNGNGSFTPGSFAPISTGELGGHLAAADLDHDGRMDLVLTDAGAGGPFSSCAADPGSVQVALQQTNGTFGGGLPKLSGTASPQSVLVGDLNGDGNPDIAVVQSSQSNGAPQDAVIIYPGAGNGTFTGPRQFNVAGGAQFLVDGVFSNARALDIAVSAFTANQVSVLVNLGANSLTLSSSLNPAGPTQAVTLTATVHPTFAGGPVPAGSVMFADGSTTLGTATVGGGGSARLTTTFSATGTHNLIAVYNGDGTFIGGASASLNQVINKASTATMLVSSNNPSVFGTSVTFTATVTSSAGTPSGTVTFFDGSSAVGTGSLNGSGVARLSTSVLTTGTHSVTANYGGDSNSTTSTSSAVSQTVNKAASVTTLTTNNNPNTYGTSVTFSATVTGAAGQPGGTVTFLDGSTTVGTGVLSISGVATLTTSVLTAGTHSITANYGGDSNFTTSTSSAVSQIVNKAASATMLATNNNPSIYGTLVIFSASITSSAGIPGGTVTFLDGTTSLGTAAVTGSGVVNLLTSGLTAGTHSITVQYAGDQNFNASTSTALTQTVNKSVLTIAIASTKNPSIYGDTVTFTFTFTGSCATPTGTAAITDGKSTLSTVTLDPAGKATFTTSALTAGAHTITASYNGDSNYF